jgi:phosphoketolase
MWRQLEDRAAWRSYLPWLLSLTGVPRTGERGICLKQQRKDTLIEHKQYIDKDGEDMPEIRNWQCGK